MNNLYNRDESWNDFVNGVCTSQIVSIWWRITVNFEISNIWHSKLLYPSWAGDRDAENGILNFDLRFFVIDNLEYAIPFLFTDRARKWQRIVINFILLILTNIYINVATEVRRIWFDLVIFSERKPDNKQANEIQRNVANKPIKEAIRDRDQ